MCVYVFQCRVCVLIYVATAKGYVPALISFAHSAQRPGTPIKSIYDLIKFITLCVGMSN